MIWIVILGGAIGSFLNVVVYRLPAGKSIVHPGSRCPSCQRPIRGYDNVPVVSWFLLRGRCRDCHAAIPIRYPIVEGMTVLIFALIGVPEVLLGGTNLPLVAELGQSNGSWLWTIYGYHLLLVCTLLCVVLIDWDGNHIPFRLFVPALAIGYLAPFFDLRLRPVGFSGNVASGSLAAQVPGAAVGGLVGLAAGLLLGVLVWPAAAGQRASAEPLLWRAMPVVMASALVGLFLGWQAAMLVVVFTAVGHLIVAAVGRRYPAARRSSWFACLAVATVVYILLWQRISSTFPMLVGQAKEVTFLAGCILVVAVAVLARMASRHCLP